jgi:hypothetical protein
VEVWLAISNKSSKCSYCHELILNNEIAIFGKIWMNYKKDEGGGKKWVKRFKWHIANSQNQCCWITDQMKRLKQNPTSETRGRKMLLLTPEQKQSRLSILRRRARVMQRLRAETEGDANIEMLIHLGDQLVQLKKEIDLVGGMPSSWELGG